jgi:hypothetical protein
MKSIIGVFMMALLLVCLALPGLVLADAEGSTASGSFKFALQDGEIRFLEFKASELGEGQAAGEMTFSDPTAIPVDDPDNPREPKSPGVLVRAKFDCMQTNKNTAIIGGEIFESNVPSAIGLRVLLVIEDNGLEGSRDRLTTKVRSLPGGQRISSAVMTWEFLCRPTDSLLAKASRSVRMTFRSSNTAAVIFKCRRVGNGVHRFHRVA